MSDEHDSIFGDVIFSYSRAQAIRDGVLVDLTEFHSVAKMWKLHLACTSTVWGIIENCGHIGDLACQLISVAAQTAAKSSPGNTDTLLFKVTLGAKSHTLKLHCGPGDTAAPVLTLMLPDED